MAQDIPICINGTFGDDSLFGWLAERFPVRRVPVAEMAEADYFIGGDFGYSYEAFHGVRIFTTGENHAADLNHFDYCLTHELIEDDRRHRLPFWQASYLVNPCFREILEHQPEPIAPDALAAEKRDFCAFICRNSVCRKRNRFVRHLNEIRKVDCAGPFMNNVGFLLPKGAAHKFEYQRRHLFSMAYENEATRGYQTEKIVDALVSRSIPLYWGNPCVEEEFNPECFVHARNFPSEKALIRHVLELAEDPVRMAAIINAPRFRDPLVMQKAEQALVDFFARIFERGPGAIRRSRYQRMQAVLSHFYGHGLSRTIRRVSRHLRGKGGDQGLGNLVSKGRKKD